MDVYERYLNEVKKAKELRRVFFAKRGIPEKKPISYGKICFCGIILTVACTYAIYSVFSAPTAVLIAFSCAMMLVIDIAACVFGESSSAKRRREKAMKDFEKKFPDEARLLEKYKGKN